MEAFICHVCHRDYLNTHDQGFVMRSEDGNEHDVCRDCVKRIFVGQITSGDCAFDAMPDARWGGVILEAFSEVVPA